MTRRGSHALGPIGVILSASFMTQVNFRGSVLSHALTLSLFFGDDYLILLACVLMASGLQIVWWILYIFRHILELPEEPCSSLLSLLHIIDSV